MSEDEDPDPDPHPSATPTSTPKGSALADMSEDGAPDSRLISGQFAPGHSGNPGGRPRRDGRTSEILNTANEPVLLAAIERALNGDVGAMKMVLDRSAPVPKAPTVPVDLGPLASPVDCVAAMSRITSALAKGILDADMATRLSAVVAAGLKVVETVDLAEQVRELQRQMRESGR